MPAKNEGGLWPTSQQLMLLTASLSPHSVDAVNAWNNWKETIPSGAVNFTSRQILPLLYRNLNRHGIEDPFLAEAEKEYRRNWMRNRQYFHQAGPTIQNLENAGIRTMILKGAALSLLYYKDVGVRYMVDLDVLVPSERREEAIDLLQSAGYKPQQRPDLRFSKNAMELIHGYSFKHPNGSNIDLHWHVLSECERKMDDEYFWANRIPLEFEKVQSSALADAEQLLHVCVHGARWANPQSIRWIADAFTIVSASTLLDWDRLVRASERMNLALILRGALSFLKNSLHAPVPEAVMEELGKIRFSRREVAEQRHRLRNTDTGILGGVPLLWHHYCRKNESAGVIRRTLGFLTSLQHHWGMDHFWQWPFHLISHSKHSIKRIAKSHRSRPTS